MKVALLTTDSREHFRQYTKPVPEFGTGPAALLQGMGELSELEVHVISCAQQPLKAPEKIAPRIFYHCVLVPKAGWMRSLYQGCIRAVRRKLREIQPDIVHGQGTERDCALSAVFSGFPNVITIHGNMRRLARVAKAKPLSFAWLAARLEKTAISRAGGVVCLTHHGQKEVRNAAQRNWIVPNAVDPSFFEIEPRPQSEPTRILCVGDVYPLKNQHVLIRACELLKTGNLRLVFLGQANRETAYAREFFQMLEYRPWCAYGGFADRAQLKDELRNAAALVLPSLEENCPMAVLEAMAAGVPVLAAAVGGVPDLIRDGESGLLFAPRDLQSISNAIQIVMSHPARAREISKRARTEAVVRFMPETIARKHLDIYREVCRIL